MRSTKYVLGNVVVFVADTAGAAAADVDVAVVLAAAIWLKGSDTRKMALGSG